MFTGRDDAVGHTARIWSTSHFYGERYILEQSEWPNPSTCKETPLNAKELLLYILCSCRYPERSTQSRQLPACMHSVLRGCGYPLGLAHICSPCGYPPITIHDSRFSPSPPQGVNTASSGEAESPRATGAPYRSFRPSPARLSPPSPPLKQQWAISSSATTSRWVVMQPSSASSAKLPFRPATGSVSSSKPRRAKTMVPCRGNATSTVPRTAECS